MDKYLIKKSSVPSKKAVAAKPSLKSEAEEPPPSASASAAAPAPAPSSSPPPSSNAPFLIGVRAYFTETLSNPTIEGLELLHSDDTSTQCGNCSLMRTSNVMPFDKDEHIIGVDFREGGGPKKSKVVELCLYTTHPEGRSISFYFDDEGDDYADDEFVDGDSDKPYVGVYNEIPYTGMNNDAGTAEKFICKRGKRMSGLLFDNGKIAYMAKESIPKGQNDEWWKKSLGYKPNEKLRLAKKNSPHLVSARASYAEIKRSNYIVGLELQYSNGPPVQWGEVHESNMSEPMALDKHEHIVAIDFNTSKKGRIIGLDLHTSHFEGRVISFSTWFCSGVVTSEHSGCYVGMYGQSGNLSSKGEDFTCKQGNRVSGITFDNGSITSMSQEPIPKGQNDKWFEDSGDYEYDQDVERAKTKRSRRVKWQMAVRKAKLLIIQNAMTAESCCAPLNDYEKTFRSLEDEERWEKMNGIRRFMMQVREKIELLTLKKAIQQRVKQQQAQQLQAKQQQAQQQQAKYQQALLKLVSSKSTAASESDEDSDSDDDSPISSLVHNKQKKRPAKSKSNNSKPKKAKQSQIDSEEESDAEDSESNVAMYRRMMNERGADGTDSIGNFWRTVQARRESKDRRTSRWESRLQLSERITGAEVGFQSFFEE